MLVHLRTEKNGVAELTKQTRTTAGWTAVYYATRDFFSTNWSDDTRTQEDTM